VNKAEMRFEREQERVYTQELQGATGKLNTEQASLVQNKCIVDNIESDNIENLTLSTRSTD